MSWGRQKQAPEKIVTDPKVISDPMISVTHTELPLIYTEVGIYMFFPTSFTFHF